MLIVLIISINKKTFFTKYSNCQTCETCAITFILPNKKKDSEEKWAVMKICKLFFLVPSKQYGFIFQITIFELIPIHFYLLICKPKTKITYIFWTFFKMTAQKSSKISGSSINLCQFLMFCFYIQ